MATELPKAYDPREAQQKWLKFWEERAYNHTRPDSQREAYTIVIPPPNVTGALHMGHALNNTLQDVLIRWRRMQGFNAEWMPGTDHAGIATQAVVERLVFQQEKKTRHDLGREELVKRIWQWKDKYEKRILDQLRELGCSCDWPRTRFTFDEGCSRAVRQTFFNWFRDGYIFRGKRLVNWDAHLQTSVADDETYVENVKSGFWTFKYPVKREGESKPEGESSSPRAPSEFIRFSTTRPETMLGDTAVCVHPNDERYKHLIGKTVTIPLLGREIPIIADGQLADPELGTGCVKVTPAHDPNDYACWQRNPQIGIINILNKDGTINENGGKYAGMDRYKAREAVTKDMEALGFFEDKQDREIPLAFSDRSKTPIEPYLSDQWFVKMGDTADGKAGFARRAMEAVIDGRVKFFPERYAQTYLDWLSEKRDWCISRQLWWGHRIPVWYGREAPAVAHITGQYSFASIMAIHKDHYDHISVEQGVLEDDGKVPIKVCVAPGHENIEKHLESAGFTRDPDVLDTWFSSQLWPHSTFGWPDKTPELAYYYPTSTLVTSRDIITLWVARMVISGLYNMGDVPFREVYITPKLMDGFGETMSKSKGNGVDPLDIIELYGTDALRYVIVSLAGETQDCRLPVANVCPHCGEQVAIKQEHMYLRTKKLACPKCKKEFRPGGPWPEDDLERPTARQGSERFEQGRNFANKLWNAARFILMNLEGYTPGPIKPDELPIEDRWILSRLATTAKSVTESLVGYHFSEVARTIYDFSWSEFCDWYIEMAKGRLRETQEEPPTLPSPRSGGRENPSSPAFSKTDAPTYPPPGFAGGGQGGGRASVQRVLVGVLDGILRLAHPVMPFVTESIWQALNEAAFERGLPNPDPSAESVMIASWPTLPESWQDPAMEKRIARMQELVRIVREIRNNYKVDPKTPVDISVRCAEELAADFRSLSTFIGLLASVAKLECGPDVKKPPQSATNVNPEFETYVSLKGLIDPAEEVKRLEKQLAEKTKQLDGTQKKLSNADFVKRAPKEVVEQQQQLVTDLQQQIRIIEETIRELKQ
jgi:valyl-tRNA synthetase